MNILVTAFDVWRRKVNPALEAVRQLDLLLGHIPLQH